MIKFLSGLFGVMMVAVASVSCNKDNNVPEAGELHAGSDCGQYKFSIAAGYTKAESEEVTTRATLDLSTSIYYWDVGDQVGLFVTDAGSSFPIVNLNNLPLAGTHTTPVEHTIFTGTLTSVVGSLLQGNTYDYYSYFPYDASLGGTFPTGIQFQVPSSLTVSPNTFKPVNMDIPMVAERKTNEPPIFYLDGLGVEHHHLLHLDYKHVMSYAAIEMDCSLTSQTITSIKITNQSDAFLSGVYSYDMISGSGYYVSGSNVLTINIPSGLIVGGGDVLYIPMPPIDMSGHSLMFEFTGTSSANVSINKSIPGANFQKGKIHYLRIAPNYAMYTFSTSFTTTVAGYYYIEAWGGDGGKGGNRGSGEGGNGGGTGGIAIKEDGLYSLTAGTTLYIYVGSAGGAGGGGSGDQTPGSGGINGSSFGNGGEGPTGGVGGIWPAEYFSGAGGGGGAASYITTVYNDITASLVVSGGAGGGGGAGTHGSNTGGVGGAGAGGNGGNGGNGMTNGATTFRASGDTNGANGIKGNTSQTRIGGSGGGGGGGFTAIPPANRNGGEGGGAGTGGSILNTIYSGGGGKGGMSYNTGTTVNPGFSLPNSSRANGANGYVVITFFR